MTTDTLEGHSGKVKASKPNYIYQIHASDINGLPTFFFVRVEPIRQKALEAAIKEGNFDIKAFGEVIRSGYGNPSREDIEFMKAEYDYEVVE